MTVRGTLARATAGGPQFRLEPDRILVEVDGEQNLTSLQVPGRDDKEGLLDKPPVSRNRLQQVSKRLNELGFNTRELENVGAIIAETDKLAEVFDNIEDAKNTFDTNTIKKLRGARARAEKANGKTIIGGFSPGNFNFGQDPEADLEARLRNELSNLSLHNALTKAVNEVDGVFNAEMGFTRNPPGPRNLNLDVLGDARTVTGEDGNGKPDLGDALKKTKVPQAWSVSRGSNAVVAVFDTAFCSEFLESGRVIDTYSGPDVQGAYSAPEEGHGTMTAYASAGNKAESGLGYNGVAPDAGLLLARLSDKEGSLKYVEEAWDWLVGWVKQLDRPVVSNHSYGVPLCSARSMDLCNATTTKLATVVNNRPDHQAFYAAGNEALYCGHRLGGITNGINGVNSKPSSITMAALRYDLRDAQNYSSHGFGTCNSVDQNPKPDVGFLLPSIVPYGCKEKDMSMGKGGSGGGTSLATPLTCGVAALMASTMGNARQVDLEEILEGTAKDLRRTQINIFRGHDARFGHGQVQPHRAVAEAAILRPEHHPQATFTFSPQNPAVGETVTFDASASTDPDEDIESYNWNFGDGTSGTGQTTTHTYNNEGNYNALLIVTDSLGNEDTFEATVNVSAEESEGANQGTATQTGLPLLNR